MYWGITVGSDILCKHQHLLLITVLLLQLIYPTSSCQWNINYCNTAKMNPCFFFIPLLWHFLMLLLTAWMISIRLITKPTYVQCSTVLSSQSCIWSPRARHSWSAQKHRLGAGRRQSSHRRSSARHTGSGRSTAAQFCRLSACPWTTPLPQWGDAEWWSCWSDAPGCLQKSMNVITVSVMIEC